MKKKNNFKLTFTIIMNNIDDYIFYEICYYLTNESILNIGLLNKKIFEKSIDKNFKKNILNRNHPIVYNIFDNYCMICNLKKFSFYFNFNSKKRNITNCYHYYNSMNPLFRPVPNYIKS